MKAVILAGGLGTRISEETQILPKPLVEIGSEPIIWHIMKIYYFYGVRDFIICCGYKGHMIKKFFDDYRLRRSSVAFDFKTGDVQYLSPPPEDWRVTLFDTGENTLTGGRLKRIRHLLDDAPFFMTYGDGVGDIDISALLAFHKGHGRKATVTAVQPTGRFGAMFLAENDPTVYSFNEKPQGDGAWINGGFFVLDPSVLDLVEGDRTVWERGPMVELTKARELVAYRHYGFWHPMDTLRDKTVLNKMWENDNPPWRVW